MIQDQSSEGGEARGRKRWIIIFSSCSLALSIFWSIDKSVLYFLLAACTFSFFKILQHWRGDRPVSGNPSYEKTYETQKPSEVWMFWQEVKEIFRKDSLGPKTPQQTRIFVALVAGFIGFIFFLPILFAIFGSDDSSESNDYYQVASEYFNNQQYDSAAYYYKFAIELDPENPDLFFDRGNAFLNADKTDSAIVMYDQALALNPQHQGAQYNKGYIYFSRKSYRQAIDETRKIMEYAPDYTEAMLLIGDSFYNQSQLDSALRWYEGAYSLGYRSAVLSHLMAYIYDTKGQTNKAIGLYREALEQDSTITDIYRRLGELVPGEEGNWYRQKAAQ